MSHPFTRDIKSKRKFSSAKERNKAYNIGNIVYSHVERCIELSYNKQTGTKSYNVDIAIQKKHYRKSYPSLEQARIFRDTILRHFEEN